MKKSIVRVVLVAAAAASFALPASPANASCSVTIQDCIDQILSTVTPAVQQCHRVNTFVEICLPAAS
ncbi:MAG TPA: hypothetical protein VNQ77_04780 [Frankiaceae bacterium]|nr:hypothetical protein [Frankiaceae bacterium]